MDRNMEYLSGMIWRSSAIWEGPWSRATASSNLEVADEDGDSRGSLVYCREIIGHVPLGADPAVDSWGRPRSHWRDYQACPTGQRPQGRSSTDWRYYFSQIRWEYLGIPQKELEFVAGDRKIWAELLSLLPPRNVEEKSMHKLMQCKWW